MPLVMLLAWATFHAALLIALAAALVPSALPGEIQGGIVSALLFVGCLWVLDHFSRSRYPAVAFSLLTTIASLWAFYISNWGGCLDWCRPWLGFLGLPTFAGMASSAAVGLSFRRPWAWASLALSPVSLFFLAAAFGLRFEAFLGVVLPAMLFLWVLVGLSTRECLSLASQPPSPG